MTTILFSTRGGEASYPNQDRVIAWARENEARLLFMYVADVRFLNLMARPIVASLEESLEGMGEFMLTMARERAVAQGVEADVVVRHGVFREALKEVIREEAVDVVGIGTPTETTGLMTRQYREGLIRELILETGVEILILEEGQIIAHYGPKNLPDEA